MKPRIVHVIDSLGIGGAQSMMFELYKAIQNLYPEYPQTIILTNKNSIDKRYIESYGMTYCPVSQPLFVKTLNEMYSQYHCVLLFHKLMQSKTDIYDRLSKIMPIVTINHTYTESGGFNRFGKCHAIVSVSEQMKKMLINKTGAYKTNHVVIHNGINYKTIEDSPAGTDRPENVFLTGRINGLNRIKYSDSWLKWCSDVKLSKKMVHEYIGGGAYLKKATRLVNSWGGPRNEVKLLGSIHTFREKISILKRWDVFLYEINRNEGVSIAILEALAAGVPVLCSNHYGNKEIIVDGVNGYVWKSHEDVQEIMERLISNPDELSKLKESTKKHFIENLDASIMAKKYIKLIEETKQKFDSKQSPVETPLSMPPKLMIRGRKDNSYNVRSNKKERIVGKIVKTKNAIIYVPKKKK